MNRNPFQDPPTSSRGGSTTRDSRRMSTQINTGSSTSRTSKSRKSDSKKGFGKKNVGSSITLQGMKKRFQTMLGKTKDSFDAVDPITKQVKNPAPLYSQNTSADMAGSYQSGNISPSSASESISDFDRASSYSFGRDIPQGEASQAGSSSPSVVSDDEESFIFSGPVGNDDTFSTTGSVDLSMVQDLDLGAADSFIKKSDVPLISFDHSNEEKLTEKQLEMLQEVDFTISLTETETFFLFDKFDESVKVDDPKIEEIREKNKVYKELLKNKENNRDNYMDKHVQTMEKFYKNKRTNTSKTEYEEVEVQVTAYQIFDDYQDIREREEREREEREIMTSLSNKQDEEDEEEGDLEDDGADDVSVKSGRAGGDKTSISSYQELVITRAVVQNIFHDRQKRYIIADDKDAPPVPSIENVIKESTMIRETPEETNPKSPVESQETPRSDTYEEEEVAGREDEKEKEREEEEKDKVESDNEEDVVNTKPTGVLTTLWEYNCEAANNYNVNNLTWNKQNNDILAAAYGSGDVTDLHQSNGVILCWNVKNPAYPERILKVDGAGVNSVNFSATNPSILAAGLSDGTVSIYDIRRKEHTPVMETIKSHTGTVWDLKWVNRGKDVGEKLHSVGVDGRVNSWTIKKGLESSEIMRLKRIGRATDFGGDAMISRESGGMSIDFSPADNLIYLVGTEDGAIFKCSSSYNEHPLETYMDHTGPVYSVRWNPVVPDMFISCSADWTVKIWNQESLSPIFTIESYSEKSDQRSYSVTDVAWSKYCSTMFATSSIVGDLELWDLSYSTVRPKYSKTKPGKLNCTIFAEDVPIVLVGDNKGSIEVLRAEGADPSQESQLEKFLQ